MTTTQAWNLNTGDTFGLRKDGQRWLIISCQHLTVGGEGPRAACPDQVRLVTVTPSGVRHYRDLDARRIVFTD